MKTLRTIWMMKNFATLLVVLSILYLTNYAQAQLVSNPYPPTPAAYGVGGAYVAAATGAEAPFWNPSGLAYGVGTAGRFSYSQPFAASFLSHLSASVFTSLPKKYGGVAVGIQTLSTRYNGHSLSNESELFASHGILLQEDIHSSLAFGYTLKMIGYNLGESVVGSNGQSEDLGSAMTFGLDVGATAQLWDRFKLGGSFKNINHPQFGSINKRDLPRILSGGVSYEPYYGVRTTFDLERTLDGEAVFKGGVNATVVKPLDLRFGVMSNPNSFTAGFGIHFKELVIDYGFIYHPVLEPSHMIGIGFDLDKPIYELRRKS